MDHVATVGLGEGATGLHEHVDDLFGGPIAVPKPPSEVWTVDELHRQERLSVIGSDLEDRDDIGVRQAPCHPGFTEKASHRLLGPRLVRRAQELECDASVQSGVVGAPHLANAAGTDALDEREPVDAKGRSVSAEQSGPHALDHALTLEVVRWARTLDAIEQRLAASTLALRRRVVVHLGARS